MFPVESFLATLLKNSCRIEAKRALCSVSIVPSLFCSKREIRTGAVDGIVQ